MEVGMRDPKQSQVFRESTNIEPLPFLLQISPPSLPSYYRIIFSGYQIMITPERNIGVNAVTPLACCQPTEAGGCG